MATAALTVNISTSSNMGEKRSSERAQIRWLLSRVEQAIGDGTSVSGNIIDQSGQNAGSFTYTPGASS
jgi:hypothetical protein